MPRYLADTSAWNRSRSVADPWARLIERNELYVCTPVKLELLYSARGRRDYADFARDLTGFPVLELTGRVTLWHDAPARASTRSVKPAGLLEGTQRLQHH